MILDDLKGKKDAINSLVLKYGANNLRVFGSVARREEKEESDVDFLVDFPRGYNLFDQRMPLAKELSKLIDKKIDLVVEHELNKHIKKYVLEEARNLLKKEIITYN